MPKNVSMIPEEDPGTKNQLDGNTKLRCRNAQKTQTFLDVSQEP
jgi:hypothetical protein